MKKFRGGDYSITQDGRVFSHKVNKWLEIQTDRVGYKKISITVDGKRRNMSVHRMVCETYVPNPDKKPCVNHVDGDKGNNTVENLEWCTHKENTRHGIKNKLITPLGKATQTKMIEVLLRSKKFSQDDIARAFRLSQPRIVEIKKGSLLRNAR